MTKKLSITIPTLQKRPEFLYQLVNSLVKDDSVGEVIVIDNSTKGLDFNNEKVRVIIPQENLFVNRSWNLGVQESKYDYIGIFNDDICIPEGFCSKIIEKISDEIGVIGTNGYSMINKSYEPETITDNSFELEEVPYTTFNYGVMLFMHKNNYYQIPEELKIFYGDDYLFVMNQKHKRKNYVIENLKMYHYGSLSSKAFSDLIKKENSLFNKFTLSIWDRLFSIKRTRTKLVIRFLGISYGIKKEDLRQKNSIHDLSLGE